ncbi:ABC-2 type transport system permease protein [Streptococcus equinus]|nr:ABC-2 type transport system permease protein [Streptococcus equinus]SFR66830.1 ABC-2 type transport system permease protein [Streptococcus equinus]
MFEKFKALLWLRRKIIISNKVILLQVLMPIGLTFLYKFMIDNQSEVQGDLGVPYLMICLSLAFVLAIGGPVLTVMAEEKEKNTLKVLILSGVHFFEYIMSTIFLPLIISALYIVILPIILDVHIENLLSYVVVCSLTIIAILLLYILLGLLAKSQVMAQTFAVPTMLVSAFLPMLSSMNETISKVVDYSYVGLFTKLFTQWESFSWNKSILQLSSLLIWIVFLLIFITAASKEQK